VSALRWGILAPGKIARSFAADLALLPEMEVAAVGSRNLANATAFSERFGGRPYGSYAELVADPDVDVVYVASPHALHDDHARLALDAGKPVLCEKAVTLDAPSAEALCAYARERGLFFMEAMWTACHPLVRAMLSGLEAGRFGVPRQVIADLGFVVDAEPSSRLLDRALGAGALLDMGIYPVTLARLVLGAPLVQRAVANVVDGIDLDVTVGAVHAGGALSSSNASMTANSPRTATVATDTGILDLGDNFHHPQRITWKPFSGRDKDAFADDAVEELVPVEPLIGRGYGNEALEVGRCLAEGLLESPLVPHAQTIGVMRQLDEIRAQVGVTYD
jgi:predicted dehydrogenase